MFIFIKFAIEYIMPSFSLSGSGGRSSGVNYATASMFDRIRSVTNFQDYKRARLAGLAFSTSYQAVTGASGGSLKRIPNYGRY